MIQNQKLKNNFNDELLELAEKYCQHNDKDLNNCLYYIFKPFMEKVTESTKEDMREDIVKKLLKTYKENYAFMSVINDQGDLEDWMIPVSEVLKILEAKNRIKDL